MSILITSWNNPSVSFADSSLYTREPFFVPESLSFFPDKHCICRHKRKIRHTSFEIYRILAKLSFRATPYRRFFLSGSTHYFVKVTLIAFQVYADLFGKLLVICGKRLVAAADHASEGGGIARSKVAEIYPRRIHHKSVDNKIKHLS